MNKIKIRGNLFYKKDKDIWDQLNQRTPSKTNTLLYLKSRGMLYSKDEDKHDLATNIAPWFTSYFDQKFIVDEYGGGNSRKRHTSTEILLEYNEENIEDILRSLRAELGFSIQKNNHSFTLTKNYTKSDFTKNTLSQNVQKTAEIKLEETNSNTIRIRSNVDEESKKIINCFKQKVKEKNPDDYEDFDIDLSVLVDAKARTEFFLKLIGQIDEYKIADMKSAAISKLDTSNSDNSEEADEETTGFIKKVVLSGGSVHQSREIQNLLSRGFYLSKIEWTMTHQLTTGDKIDLYAEFEDPTNCTGFKYALLKVYPSKKDGTYNIVGKSPSEIEVSDILPRIEIAAKKSFKMIYEMYVEQQETATEVESADEDN